MLKVATNEVIKYIPKKERGQTDPTTINFIPLNKKKWDKYQNSQIEIKGKKVIARSDDSTKLLFELCLAKDEKGVYIYNIFSKDGKPITEVVDLSEAVNLLLELQDVETANEIELAMRSYSTLTEDEEKNSDG